MLKNILTVVGVGIQLHKDSCSILLYPEGGEDSSVDHRAIVCHSQTRATLQSEVPVVLGDVDQSVLAQTVERVLPLVQSDDVRVSVQPDCTASRYK